MAAIRVFDEPIVLLLGGRDKDLPWEQLMHLVSERVDHLVLFGEAAEKIEKTAERLGSGRKHLTVARTGSLKEAVLKALGHGLSFGLERVVFALEGDRVAGLQAVGDDGGGVAGWHILRLAPAPTLLGTLAWRGAPRTVRCLAWVG